mgnify:CR=1 FL=1
MATQSDPELVTKVDSIARSSIEAVIDKGQGRGERNEHIKQAERDAIEQLETEYDSKAVAKVFDDVLKRGGARTGIEADPDRHAGRPHL